MELSAALDGARPLPRRLWIAGVTGSGKSTLGAQLAAAAGVPFVDMDELHWRPGWTTAPDDVIHADLDAATRGAGWVCVGNYTRFRERVADRIEQFVWIDLPWRTSFARLLGRTWDRARHGTPCCHGNRESLRMALLSRDSILLWAITQHRRTRARLARAVARRPVWRLRTPAEVEALGRAYRALSS